MTIGDRARDLRPELLIDCRAGLLRAALVVGGRLTDLHIDRLHIDRLADQGVIRRNDGASGRCLPQTGSLWFGRVERLSSALNAAFVDLGTGKAGLLGLADVRLPPGRRPEPGTAIGSVLRSGQGVVVQVKTEAVGSKGPTLSMDVSLAGRFLVHVPYRRGVTVSKRVGPGAVRGALTRRLQALTTGDGWIARSGVEDMTADDLLIAESTSLILAWRAIQTCAAEAGAPACLSPAPDAARRAVIGQGVRPLARVAVEAPEDWSCDFAAWCAESAPDLVPCLERHSGSTALFECFDLEGQLAALIRPRAPLPGGGNLMIEHTEALTVIDVNAGERGNPLAVNLEAAVEIARHLRLRNIGGIIIVDFVSMPRRGDGERLLDALTAATRDDPVQTEVYGLSKLGLVEMTRARRGPMLDRLLVSAEPFSPLAELSR